MSRVPSPSCTEYIISTVYRVSGKTGHLVRLLHELVDLLLAEDRAQDVRYLLQLPQRDHPVLVTVEYLECLSAFIV